MTRNKNIDHNQIQHDKVASFYNIKHTEIYNFYEQDRLEKTIDYVIESSGAKELKVLDFGAGTGNLSRIFADKGCQVTACDVSQVSLDILTQNLPSYDIKTVLYDGVKLPFVDDSFDVVATYSVLHHIPDYLSAILEMVRVVKKGGLVYIEHEASENKWNPTSSLKEYYSFVRQTRWEHLKKLFRTRELFTFDFFKAVFIKTFINKRYEREGDIHVWVDDHIEWDKVKKCLTLKGYEIFKEVDYLMYKPKGGMDLFNNFKDRCADTKYIIIKK